MFFLSLWRMALCEWASDLPGHTDAGPGSLQSRPVHFRSGPSLGYRIGIEICSFRKTWEVLWNRHDDTSLPLQAPYSTLMAAWRPLRLVFGCCCMNCGQSSDFFISHFLCVHICEYNQCFFIIIIRGNTHQSRFIAHLLSVNIHSDTSTCFTVVGIYKMNLFVSRDVRKCWKWMMFKQKIQQVWADCHWGSLQNVWRKKNHVEK